jgi:nucleotidyltransferase substrate binding protein (TIGR01987 family)
MENKIILEDINIAPLLKAYSTFEKGLNSAKSQLEKDGVIQRFEYTLELCWKTLRKILKHKGITANSPRDAFREAHLVGIIEDTESWYTLLKKRNLASHTYNEETATEIFLELHHANDLFEELIKKISNL